MSINTVLPPMIVHASERIFANQADIYGLDARSGELRRRYPIAGLPSAPAVVGDVLYINVSNHPQDSIQALSVHDGSLLWKYEVDGRLVGNPVIADGVLYSSTAEGTIYALQASSGTLLWHSSIDEPGAIVLTAPTVADGVVYLAPVVHHPLPPRLYAFHARDGGKLWETHISDGAAFPLTVAKEVIFMSRHRGCSALSARDGSPLWHYETSSHTCSSPVVFHGTVYLSCLEHNHEASLCALDANNGSLQWALQLGNTADPGRPTAPHVTTDTIYVGRADGTLSAYQTTDRNLLWRYQTSGSLLSSPTAANGVVSVGANDGCMYALRASDGVLLWQTFVSVAASMSTFSAVLTLAPWKS